MIVYYNVQYGFSLFGLRIAQTSETPLWAANNRGHVEVVKALIEAGADVNLADEVNDSIEFKAIGLVSSLLAK